MEQLLREVWQQGSELWQALSLTQQAVAVVGTVLLVKARRLLWSVLKGAASWPPPLPVRTCVGHLLESLTRPERWEKNGNGLRSVYDRNVLVFPDVVTLVKAKAAQSDPDSYVQAKLLPHEARLVRRAVQSVLDCNLTRERKANAERDAEVIAIATESSLGTRGAWAAMAEKGIK